MPNRRSVLASLSAATVATGLAAIWVGRDRGKGETEFSKTSTAEEVTAGLDLSDKNILVTGCNSGLGFETMRVLASRGAHVIGTARTMEKAVDAAERSGGNITPSVCELADFATISACAEHVRGTQLSLDAVICNAGMMGNGERQTVRGIEKQFVVNYLGHFFLIQRLLPLLQAAPQGRIVMVSSGLYTRAPDAGIEFDNLSGARDYDRFKAYGQSKLAVALFAEEFARRYSGGSVTANALYPGVIHTELTRHQPWFVDAAFTLGGWAFMKSVEEGAATQCFVATHPSLTRISGMLFADCTIIEPEGPHLGNTALGRRLWDESIRLVEKWRVTSSRRN